jgi:FKBP-type peptidyl-prolyl cis-trans isomerase
MKNHLFFLFLVFLLNSCTNYSDHEKKQFDDKIQQLLKTKKWKMTKSDSGIYEEVIEEGNGKEIQLGDILICKYTGRLLNDNVFDHSEKAIELPLNSLIAGWKEVLIGKKNGAFVRFICPPHMAYGRSGREKIPENSVLIFEVKIIDLK